jgi:hypothetical protein
MIDIKLSNSAFLRIIDEINYTTDEKQAEPKAEPIAVVLSEDSAPVRIFPRPTGKPDCGCGGKGHASPGCGGTKGVFIALALVTTGFAIAYVISKMV